MKSEEKAREICESQIFHGAPNIDSFFKVDPNTLSAEVAGRRNGYIYSDELANIKPADTRGFYWGVAFMAPESVKLFYDVGEKTDSSKIISWAASCKNMTLLQISSNGKFIVKRVFVKGKAWKQDRYVPQDMAPSKAYVGYALEQYFKKYYYDMYGIWEEIDEEVKEIKENINKRKNAVNTMNDEEVDVGRILQDVNEFIEDGNVSDEEREKNEKIRKNIKEKNKLRERAIRNKVREAKKAKRKKEKRERRKLNPLL